MTVGIRKHNTTVGDQMYLYEPLVLLLRILFSFEENLSLIVLTFATIYRIIRMNFSYTYKASNQSLKNIATKISNTKWVEPIKYVFTERGIIVKDHPEKETLAEKIKLLLHEPFNLPRDLVEGKIRG